MIRVAVPAEEGATAHAALERWDGETGGRRGELAAVLRNHTLLFLVSVGVVLLLVWVVLSLL